MKFIACEYFTITYLSQVVLEKKEVTTSQWQEQM